MQDLTNGRDTGQRTDLGEALFTAVAENRSGVDGESWIEGGLRLEVRSPTAPERRDPGPRTADNGAVAAESRPATNPEELLALSWATCLNAAARVVAGPGVDVVARTRVALHPRLDGHGFEFSAHAELSFDGRSPEEAEALAAAAHERCPVSRMLAGRSPVSVVAVPEHGLRSAGAQAE